MPRVNELTADRKVQANLIKITRELREELRDNKISYTKIANLLNKTPAAISKQFQPGNHITIETYIMCQMILKGEI